VVVPNLASGTYNLQVVNPDTQKSNIFPGFFVLPGSQPPPVGNPAPTITSVNPPTGPAAGGTSVTITGTGFVSGSKVFFGTAQAAVTATTATQLTVTTPVMASGSLGVTVVNPDTKTSNAATFVAQGGGNPQVPPPVVTGISPTAGPTTGGTIIVVTGTDFQSTSQVFIGGIQAAPQAGGVQNTTTLTVVAPALPLGPADVKVVNPSDGQQSVLHAAFTVVTPPGPSITSIAPRIGPAPGTVVLISGNNFQPASKVFFANIQASVVGTPTATSITVNVPALPVLGPTDVKIVNPDGQQTVSLGGFVALTAAPQIVSVSPVSAPQTGGTIVQISGTGFQSGSAVFIGGVQAIAGGVPTANLLTVVLPALTPGPVDVRVVNPDGQSSAKPNAILITAVGGPVITSVVPNAGPAAGGEVVQINGSNFLAGAQVFFGSAAATPTGTQTSTTLTVIVPQIPAGATDVRVLNPDGKQFILPGAFNAQGQGQTGPAPTVSGVSPNSAVPGAQVTITGTNFVAGTTVTIGGVAAPVSGTPTATSITVTVPALASGAAAIKVTNPDGQSATLSGQFTVQPLPPVQLFAVNPNSDPVGATVTLFGNNFAPGTKVFFGSLQATVTTVSTTSLSVTVPNLSLGAPVDVKVVNPDNSQAILSGAFTVVPH
jgi:hypothetical protein